MIQINLMPPELRAARRAGSLRVPWRPIGLAAAALAVLFSVVLPLTNFLRARSIDRLRGEWKTLEPQSRELEKVQKDFQQLKRQAEALQSVKAPQAQWAPRLSLLSEALVPQVWLTQLEYAQGKALRLKGSALVGAGGDVRGQVTQFLQQLKDRPGFQDWFQNVELESVEHRTIQNEEVVDFVLLLAPTG